MGNQLGKLECTAGFLHQKEEEEEKKKCLRNYRSKRGKWSSETNQKARQNAGKMKT